MLITTLGLPPASSLSSSSSPCSRFIFPTPSGVMCLDVHPDHPFLLAVGLYDGTVCVYDLQQGGSEPLLRSTANSGKHTDPVWQVREG